MSDDPGEGWPRARDPIILGLEDAVFDGFYAISVWRELRARGVVESALPRGLGWLVDHPRLLAAYFRLRPSKRPTFRVYQR